LACRRVEKVHIQRAHSGSATRICAYTPVVSHLVGPGALPLPAEILVLDPDPSSVVLGVMA